MKDGMIMQIDEPLSLYHYPNNLFVADFVKGINIIEGRINDGHFIFNDQKIALLEHFDNMKASIGIRSEDIILNGDIDVTVDEYEYLGDETIIHARMNGIRIKIKSLTYLNADKLKIGFDNSKLLIFDENGNLLRKDRSI